MTREVRDSNLICVMLGFDIGLTFLIGNTKAHDTARSTSIYDKRLYYSLYNGQHNVFLLKTEILPYREFV